MAHGYPDWGGATPTQTISAVPDFGELAVRLGSPVSFDRRGNVYYIDSFEGGLGNWPQTLVGAGSYVALDDNYQRTGRWSALLRADGTAGSLSRIQRYYPYPVLTALGLEQSISFDTGVAYVNTELSVYDNLTRWRAIVRYDYINHKIQYFSSGGVWVDLGTNIYLYGFLGEFHTIKIVANFSTHTWVRVIVDNYAYDVSAALYSLVVGSPTYALTPILTIYPNEPNPVVGYVDDVIITINEP